MRVLVYNEDSNKMERYERSLGSPMPYIKNKYLTLKEYMEQCKETHENKIYYVNNENEQSQYINIFMTL